MKLLALLLTSCAGANPTAPAPRYAPLIEHCVGFTGQREIHVISLSADGTYWRHEIHTGSHVEVREMPVIQFHTRETK